MQQTCIPGISTWSQWQSGRDMPFNSYFIRNGEENLLIDPLPLDERDAEQIERAGGAAWIVVTNRDHERAAEAAAERFQARVAASHPDAEQISVRVDRALFDGETLGGARVIALQGCKTAGEFALCLPSRQTAIVGDVLLGDPAGSLRMMDAAKLIDSGRAIASLCRLRSLHPRHVLVGDGISVFDRAYEAINACLDSCIGANVVNLDELTFRSDDADPAKFRAEAAEIGFRIGAEKLGYRVARLDPGVAFCPMHWHIAEEELFIVWEGTPSIEGPSGTTQLRRGDFVAFPTREAGAHKLINRSDAPATVVLIANTDPHDVCLYPDSKKLLVEVTDMMVRSGPILDYYDGET
jgi:uncharacterized cupin superfamily protein